MVFIAIMHVAGDTSVLLALLLLWCAWYRIRLLIDFHISNIHNWNKQERNKKYTHGEYSVQCWPKNSIFSLSMEISRILFHIMQITLSTHEVKMPIKLIFTLELIFLLRQNRVTFNKEIFYWTKCLTHRWFIGCWFHTLSFRHSFKLTLARSLSHFAYPSLTISYS